MEVRKIDRSNFYDHLPSSEAPLSPSGVDNIFWYSSMALAACHSIYMEVSKGVRMNTYHVLLMYVCIVCLYLILRRKYIPK